MHKIALNFEDGVTRFVECGPNELVVDAAYRARINIPMDCRDGVCGTCKSHCETGRYSLDSYIEDALTEEEAQARFVLTCQMRPESDCVLSIPATSKICKSGPEAFGARLHEVRRLSDTTLGFTLALDEPDKLTFLPGQYMQVGVPGTSKSRAYSFSSAVKDGCVDFLVRNISGGLMSTYLSESATTGDRLKIQGPSGTFYLRDMNRPTLFLAGGTGLAPFLAMLDHLKARGASSHPIHLVYGVTRDVDMVEVGRLEDFAETVSNFTFELCVSDPSTDARKKGFVTNFFGVEELYGGDSDVYLCGPPPMVEAVRKHFDALGVKPASFYYEKFLASELA